jgi:flagellin-specific chaperone FliS
MVKKISLYQEVELHTKVAGASPHRLVQLLYESALVHLQLAQQLLIVAEPNKDQLAMLERSLI